MALTTFSNIQLAEQQASLEQLWAEPQKQKNYTPRVDSLKAILEQQTAILSPLEDSEKEHDFKVKFVDHVVGAPASFAQNDNCANVKGTEGTGKTVTFALDYKKELTYSVERDQLEKSLLPGSEMIAIGQAGVIRALLEDFNATIPAALDTNRGTPTAALVAGATGWATDIPNKEIEIATANWQAENIIPQLMKVSRLRRNASHIIMDGGSLFNEYYKGLKSVPNADGKLVNEMYNDIPYRHDLDAFAAASLTSSFYVIDPGTVAIANRAKYPSIAQAKMTHGASGSYLRYSLPVNIPGMPAMMFVGQGGLIKQNLVFDVQYGIVCDGGKEYDTWNFKLRAGVFFNPVRLAATNTGIDKFTKV